MLGASLLTVLLELQAEAARVAEERAAEDRAAVEQVEQQARLQQLAAAEETRLALEAQLAATRREKDEG